MSQTPHAARVAVAAASVCLVLGAGRLPASESDWYVDATFGRAWSDARFGSVHPKWTDDEAATGALAVGLRFSRFLGVQAGYHDLGNHHGHGSPCRQEDDACIERLAGLGLCAEGFECTEVLVNIDADISGWSLAVAPVYPLGERLSLRGKLGLMFWRAAVTGSEGFGRIETLSGEDLLAGIGLQFALPGRLGLLAEYDAVDLDASALRLGLTWQF